MIVRIVVALASAGACLLAPGAAKAFGPDGHRIAGLLAEPLLCDSTAAQIAALTGGERFEEIGLWADTIRSNDSWRHTGPWHYMNIDDGASIESFEHPPEGDVLWAIERQSELLAGGGSRRARADALRFLVHFVVDVHQPLHVGREADRGGNTIDVRFDGETITLHRFWDTEALRLDRTSRAEYAASLVPIVRLLSVGPENRAPAEWAAESLALRPWVYAFTPRAGGAVLNDLYLERAESVTRLRLAQAAARVAALLNRILAPRGQC